MKGRWFRFRRRRWKGTNWEGWPWEPLFSSALVGTRWQWIHPLDRYYWILPLWEGCSLGVLLLELKVLCMTYKGLGGLCLSKRILIIICFWLTSINRICCFIRMKVDFWLSLWVRKMWINGRKWIVFHSITLFMGGK